MSDPYTSPGVTRRALTPALDGTDGRDLLIAGDGDTTLQGGWGDDTLIGGAGNDMLVGGRVSLIPHPDDNLLDGGTGNDSLHGALGNDTLLGGAGDDVLAPGAGHNLLQGGAGRDTFVLAYSAPLAPGPLIGQNVILDFRHGDIIDLSGLNSRIGDIAGPSGPIPFTFIGTAAFDGHGPELRYRYAGFTTVIELDMQKFAQSPADGQADASITLFGHHVLTASDFIL